MCGHFKDTSRAEMRFRDAKWTHVFYQLDYSQFTIEKDDIDRKEHPKRMYAVAWAQPKGLIGGERAAKHQPTQPLEESVSQFDAICQASARRTMFDSDH